MRRYVIIGGIVVAALVVLCIVMFFVQNSARVTQLSPDLGLFGFMSGLAWELNEPIAVPTLMVVCFAAGLGLAGIPLGFRSMRLASRNRSLEAQASMQEGDTDPWA